MSGKEKQINSEGSEIIVLGIAGPSGSGKSTLVRNIATLLEDSETMFYDDYEPNYDKLTMDLGKLRNGRTITYPVGNRLIHPRKFIVIEEPTGRRRPGMYNKIDFLAYINIPLEVSLARVLIRSIETSEDNLINSFYETIGPQFNPKFSEKSTKLMHILHWQLRMYLQRHRQIYLNDHNENMKDADLIVDGMKAKDELSKEIFDNFIRWIKKI